MGPGVVSSISSDVGLIMFECCFDKHSYVNYFRFSILLNAFQALLILMQYLLHVCRPRCIAAVWPLPDNITTQYQAENNNLIQRNIIQIKFSLDSYYIDHSAFQD